MDSEQRLQLYLQHLSHEQHERDFVKEGNVNGDAMTVVLENTTAEMQDQHVSDLCSSAAEQIQESPVDMTHNSSETHNSS